MTTVVPDPDFGKTARQALIDSHERDGTAIPDTPFNRAVLRGYDPHVNPFETPSGFKLRGRGSEGRHAGMIKEMTDQQKAERYAPITFPAPTAHWGPIVGIVGFTDEQNLGIAQTLHLDALVKRLRLPIKRDYRESDDAFRKRAQALEARDPGWRGRLRRWWHR